MSDRGDITRLLHEMRDGKAAAFDRLMPVVYDALNQLARQQLRRGSDVTLSTAGLVHETYLKMVRQDRMNWENRTHFYGIAARAMRQVLVDYARKRSAAKRGGDQHRITLASRHGSSEMRLDDLLALDRALDRLNQLNERLRQVVEYRFFGGMSVKETAAMLAVSTRTVERDWAKARLFLHTELYPDVA